ncbi:MAG: DNA gyrase subunit A, partial [Planctomycetaceae bacterium]|nr:DNA gyrase subunit A [Planctomycetaceae bacterium]
TGGIICGRYGIRKGYATGRSTITLRARTHFETEKQSDVIVVTEIPYMETRDRIREKLETLVRDDRVKGISRIVDLTDRNVPPWKVHLQIILKRDADKEVVLAQLFKFSPLQSTFSIILLALVGNRPETLSIKELIQQFILHRIDVIRRRTEFLLAEARKRKHTVEGLMIAQIDIDEVIKTIRNSPSRAEAKIRLQGLQVDGKLIERALGEDGFKEYQNEQGVHEYYSLSANQAEAIVSMQLGSLANLEREKLSGEHQELLKAISEYLYLLSDEDHIRAVIREDMLLLQQKYSDKRRTDITDDELTDVNRDDLITEEPMVVTLSQRGYIKRTQLNTYQAQNRGGKGVKGAKTDEEDPIQHLFVASTHSYLLFITNRGRVYWQKVYDLPLQGRTAKGRALVNLLSLQEDEAVSNCVAVREFDEERFLVMATRNGIIKKSPLSAYSRPQKGGIIAIKLDEDDELVEALIVSPGEDLLLATSDGMAIRFAQTDARSMGRNTRGVKGIKLSKSGHVIGMVIADPETCLLTVCENGYGKRTPFGFIPAAEENEEEVPENEEELTAESDSDSDENSDDEQETRSGMHYRRQRRGGKGIRDIRTSARNGKAVDIIPVAEDDEVLMVTTSGKIQRVRGCEISQVGRNTQGVRVITLDANDKLVSLARIPAEIVDESENEAPVSTPENNIQPTIDTESSTDEIE